MLSDHLEKLVWNGQAVVRTFTIGGSEKHILPVQQGSWIIILNMLYFPRVPGRATNDDAAWSTDRVTQMNVFSDSQFNSFVIREEFRIMQDGGVTRYGGTGTPFEIRCYLPHEKDVAFDFISGQNLTSVTSAVTFSAEPSKSPPLDFGGHADAGAMATDVKTRSQVGANIYQGGKAVPRSTAVGDYSYEQLAFPIVAANRLANYLEVQAMPIVQVTYAEIRGTKPNDIRPGS